MVAIAWIGYDAPRKLGDRETGGGLSLPVWIDFMKVALNGVPVKEQEAPEGVINIGGEWFYEEYTGNTGVKAIQHESDKTPSPVNEEEKKSILDLFRQ